MTPPQDYETVHPKEIIIQEKTTGLIITGIEIPFWDLVILLVKLAFAAIPAAIIVSIIWAFIWSILAGGFSGIWR